jgi:hypothetical protein
MGSCKVWEKNRSGDKSQVREKKEGVGTTVPSLLYLLTHERSKIPLPSARHLEEGFL